jgi:two-component system sensor histidine kinase PhoQ
MLTAADDIATTAQPGPAAMSRRPTSLQTRLIWGASVALFAFLGLTGFALDQAFYESTLEALRERMKSYVLAYMAGSDVTVAGKLILPEYPPDDRFDRPQSGLYAGIVGKDIQWSSFSALGHALPFDVELAPNADRFQGPIETEVGRVYVYSLGVDWEYAGQGDVNLTFHIAEDVAAVDAQLAVFRRTLWAWLGGVGVVLLVFQIAMLRWSLRPLRRVSHDLARVERGETDRLTGRYPRELEGLTESLNAFIVSEREQRARYRNTLSDLAHSLKTPLAVVRSELENTSDATDLRPLVAEQVARMDEIVAYQLSRAATSGHRAFAAPIALEAPAEEVVQSLEKVYADKNVLCEFDIDPEARFFGEQGDLMELLGNLLENAFKWAAHRVLLTVRRVGSGQQRRAGLELVVEDDGPGIPADQVERLLERGERGDERVQGHGIGLSIVLDILRAYRGALRVGRSETLGGAAFAVRIEPVT